MLDLSLMKGQSGGVVSDVSEQEMKSLWDAVLTDADMSGQFGTLFNTFWKPTRLIAVNGNTYTIEVKNIFAKSQFEKNMRIQFASY